MMIIVVDQMPHPKDPTSEAGWSWLVLFLAEGLYDGLSSFEVP